jgi:DNA-binding transcriptional ArsR family regulator
MYLEPIKHDNENVQLRWSRERIRDQGLVIVAQVGPPLHTPESPPAKKLYSSPIDCSTLSLSAIARPSKVIVFPPLACCIFCLTSSSGSFIFNQMVKYSSNRLDAVFAALSDPTRRAIIKRLATGVATVTELAEPFAMSLPAISKHLHVLQDAGLVSRTKDGRIHRLQLEVDTLKEAIGWLEQYRQFWESSLESLQQFVTNPKKQ